MNTHEANLLLSDHTIAEARRIIRQTLSGWKIKDAVIDDMILACTEGVTNAARHGYNFKKDSSIELSFSLEKGLLTISIRDYGKGLNMESYCPPNHAEQPEGGYGVDLMRRLCHEMTVLGHSPGTEIILKRYIDRELP